jgi:hypothetical protein
LPSSADPRGVERARGRSAHCGVKLRVDPESRTVRADQLPTTMTFRATVTVKDGWQGQVTLSLKGLLDGAQSGPAGSRTIDVRKRHRSQSTGLVISLDEHVRPGSYPVRAIARCGKDSDSDGLRLLVTKPRPGQALGVRPAEVTIQPGDRTQFCITGARDARKLKVAGLPARASASFSRRHRHQDCLWMTVRTKMSTPAGDYPLTISAKTGGGPPSSITAILHIINDAQPFTISGDLADELSPSTPQSLDLTFTNPNTVPLTLTNLSVVADHLDPAHAAACPVADNYVATQFSGPYASVVIPPSGTTSFSALGIPRDQWPQIEMLDTDQNQDGCLGATLTLTYSGTAVG